MTFYISLDLLNCRLRYQSHFLLGPSRKPQKFREFTMVIDEKLSVYQVKCYFDHKYQHSGMNPPQSRQILEQSSPRSRHVLTATQLSSSPQTGRCRTKCRE